MSKGKALTFEEVWISSDREPGGLKDYALNVFELSRLGMIPADRAIEVPDVGEWPSDAIAIHLSYATATAQYTGMKIITRIPRPVPAWTPKVGDNVCFVYEHCLLVGRVVGLYPKGAEVECNGENFPCPNKALKPFSPEKIGLPWSEI